MVHLLVGLGNELICIELHYQPRLGKQSELRGNARHIDYVWGCQAEVLNEMI